MKSFVSHMALSTVVLILGLAVSAFYLLPLTWVGSGIGVGDMLPHTAFSVVGDFAFAAFTVAFARWRLRASPAGYETSFAAGALAMAIQVAVALAMAAARASDWLVLVLLQSSAFYLMALGTDVLFCAGFERPLPSHRFRSHFAAQSSMAAG